MEERLPVPKKQPPRIQKSEGIPEHSNEIASPSSASSGGASPDYFRYAVWGIFGMAVIGFLYFAKPFFMPVFLAVLLYFLLRPGVHLLGRLRIPPLLGAFVVLSLFLGVTGIVVSHIAQPAAEWVNKAPQNLDKLEEKLARLVRPFAAATARAEEVITEQATGSSPKIEVKQSKLPATIFDFAGRFFMGTVETVVLLYFMLALGDVFVRKAARLWPWMGNRKQSLQIARELQQSVSRFLFTITCINVTFGAVVGVSARLLNMPNPALWGAVAAVLNFIPYFGPLTGVVVFAIAGLVTFDNVGQALLPAVVYLGLHGIESNFVTPLVLGRRLTMNPLLIFLSLMFWTWLWGIPGALLSVPFLMMFKVVCEHIPPLANWAEFLGGPEPVQKLEAAKS